MWYWCLMKSVFELSFSSALFPLMFGLQPNLCRICTAIHVERDLLRSYPNPLSDFVHFISTLFLECPLGLFVVPTYQGVS